MSKTINIEDLTATISIAECSDGFWLYDSTRGMNLSMRAKTRDSAFIEALEYYQHHLNMVENDYEEMKDKVDKFVSLFSEDQD